MFYDHQFYGSDTIRTPSGHRPEQTQRPRQPGCCCPIKIILQLDLNRRLSTVFARDIYRHYIRESRMIISISDVRNSGLLVRQLMWRHMNDDTSRISPCISPVTHANMLIFCERCRATFTVSSSTVARVDQLRSASLSFNPVSSPRSSSLSHPENQSRIHEITKKKEANETNVYIKVSGQRKKVRNL